MIFSLFLSYFINKANKLKRKNYLLWDPWYTWLLAGGLTSDLDFSWCPSPHPRRLFLCPGSQLSVTKQGSPLSHKTRVIVSFTKQGSLLSHKTVKGNFYLSKQSRGHHYLSQNCPGSPLSVTKSFIRPVYTGQQLSGVSRNFFGDLESIRDIYADSLHEKSFNSLRPDFANPALDLHVHTRKIQECAQVWFIHIICRNTQTVINTQGYLWHVWQTNAEHLYNYFPM